MSIASPALRPEQIAFYQENGYLAVEDVFPADHVARLRQRIEELCADFDGEAAKAAAISHEPAVTAGRVPASAHTVRKFARLTECEPLFREHAMHPALLDIVAALIGEPILLYEDQALLKPPEVGSPKPPHQDNAYFRVEPPDAVITCWAALDDATPENGCMRYFVGTHQHGLVEHEAIPNTPHLVPRGLRHEDAALAPVKAGGVVFHHSLTLHCSDPNRSDRWRRAFVCHYVREGAEMTRRPEASGLLRVR